MKKYNFLNKKSGVYVIKNTVNNKVYIGSAVNIYQRIKDHVKCLKSKNHRNSLLQNHFNKYGMSFYFEVLELCEKENLINVEQFMLNKYMSYERKNGFNINKVASSMLGFKHTDKTKKAWSDKRKGVKLTKEAKINMSKAKSGSNHPKAKLNESDVLEIRENYDSKRNYSKRMAEKYNVSWHTINYILKRRTWKHI